MIQATGMHLRHDSIYPRCIIAEAVRLHQRQTSKDRVMLGVLRNHLPWLKAEAMTDEAFAWGLVNTIAKLEEISGGEFLKSWERTRERPGL